MKKWYFFKLVTENITVNNSCFDASDAESCRRKNTVNIFNYYYWLLKYFYNFFKLII